MYVSKDFKRSIYQTLLNEYDKVFKITLDIGFCDETEIPTVILILQDSWKKISTGRHKNVWCNKFAGFVKKIEIEQDLLKYQYKPVIQLICVSKLELSISEMNSTLKISTNHRWQTATKSPIANAEISHIGIEDYKKTVQSIFKKKTFFETKYLENVRSISFCGVFKKQNRKQVIKEMESAYEKN